MGLAVIPALAGIQIAALDSRLRGNDVTQKSGFDKAGRKIRKTTSKGSLCAGGDPAGRQ